MLASDPKVLLSGSGPAKESSMSVRENITKKAMEKHTPEILEVEICCRIQMKIEYNGGHTDKTDHRSGQIQALPQSRDGLLKSRVCSTSTESVA